MSLIFPSNAIIEELNANNKLDDVLTSFSRIILQHSDRKQVAQWCREYLKLSTDKSVHDHKLLRKAVFHLIFHERLLIDSPLETFWDVTVLFGPQNQTAAVKYLESSPRSVELKFGRFIFLLAEFGKDPKISHENFEKIIVIVFSVAKISEAVITAEWKQNMKNFSGYECRTILSIADYFEPQGSVRSILMLFPQLSPSRVYGVLLKTGQSMEQLTQNILENPNYIEKTLVQTSISSGSQKTKKPKKFVLLDEREKQERAESIRKLNQKKFVYEYIPLEEEDPDPEDDGPIKPELSEADQKLADQEETLWRLWQSNREVFDKASRKTELRKQLCNKLKWTNEQVEGWGRVIGPKGRGGENDRLRGRFEEAETYAPDKKPQNAQDGNRTQGLPRETSAEPAKPLPPKHSHGKNTPHQSAESKNKQPKPTLHARNNRPKKSGKKNHNVEK